MPRNDALANDSQAHSHSTVSLVASHASRVRPRRWRAGFIAAILLVLFCHSNAHAQTGACCNVVVGTCSIQTLDNCGAAAHTWIQSGTCTPNTCAVPGACCTDAGLCRRLTEDRCTTAGFSWTSGTCSTTVCANTGQCCNFITGNCTVTAQSACGLAAHTWTSGGTCSPNTCPATGACCTPQGLCRRLTQERCILGNVWSFGGSCAPGPCTALGRCCNVFTGGCSTTMQSACGLAAHTWTFGGACMSTDCSLPGACCNLSGLCTRVVQERCPAGGVWTLAGVCSPSPCTIGQGRCCDFFAGSCTITLNSQCDISSGSWTLGGVCTPNTCEQPGACCRTGSCRTVTSTVCGAQGGLFIFGNSCSPLNPCPIPLALAACRADFNGSGAVDVTDVFDFLTAWLAGDPRTLQAGQIGASAVLDFVNEWFAGCGAHPA